MLHEGRDQEVPHEACIKILWFQTNDGNMLVYSRWKDSFGDSTTSSHRIACDVEQDIAVFDGYPFELLGVFVTEIRKTICTELTVVYVLAPNERDAALLIYSLTTPRSQPATNL